MIRIEHRWDSANDRWYRTEGDPTGDLLATVKRIRSKQSWRASADDLAMQLYSDCRYVGYRSAAGNWEPEDVLSSRVNENVIRSISRTIHSKVCRHRPRPVVLTDGASWEMKHRSELLDTWINGKLAELRADTDIFPQAILHAVLFGTGVIRSYGDPDRGACLEVIPQYEVVVDDSDARYGSPRTIYIIRVTDRGVLAATFPDKEEIINKSADASTLRELADSLGRWESADEEDRRVVIEAIHLPSGDKTGDGRRTICTDTGCLLDEEWTRPNFPLAFIRGERRPMGFWGIGLAEDLAGAQSELTGTIKARQEMIRLLSVPFWLVERGSKVVKSHISNLIGRIVEYSGAKPELVTPQAVPAELWRHADNLKKTMFESRGVSQLTAQAIKPAGLNSGRALRTYTDLESELLVDLIRAYERLVLDCAHLLIEEQEALGRQYASQAVTVIGRGKIDRISWKEAQMPSDEYRIQIVPASSLSATVSGRIEDIFDLRDLGAITDPEEIRDLLDLPDLKRNKRRTMAHRELLEMVIEKKILGEGIYVQPEPTWDLELAMKLGLQCLAEAELYEDAPEERLDLLREWIAMCEFMLRPPPPPPAPEPALGPTPDMAALPPPPEAMGEVPPSMEGIGLPPPPGAAVPMGSAGAPAVPPAPNATLPPNSTGLA